MQRSSEKIEEFKSGWPLLVAATLGCGAGLTSLPYYSLGTFISPLGAEFGWSRGDIASAFLYTTLTLAALSPILGALIDRVGVRIFALVSIPMFSAILFALSRFDGPVAVFQALYALMAIVAIGTSPINYSRAVNGWFDKGRGLALGISQAGVGVAAIVLPGFLLKIEATYGWRAGFLALAIVALLPWPFVFFGIRERLTKVVPSNRPTSEYQSAFKTVTFWTIGFAFAFVAVGIGALIVHMVPMLRDAGMTPAAAAGVASTIGFGVLGGRLAAGYMIDRLFAPYVAATLFIVTAIGCLLLIFQGPAVAPLAAVLIGFSIGAETDFMAFLTANYFGTTRYGRNYAVIYAMFAVGAAFGPALAGKAFDASGSYTSTLWGVVILLVVSSSALLTLPRYEHLRQATKKPTEAGDVEIGRSGAG